MLDKAVFAISLTVATCSCTASNARVDVTIGARIAARLEGAYPLGEMLEGHALAQEVFSNGAAQADSIEERFMILEHGTGLHSGRSFKIPRDSISVKTQCDEDTEQGFLKLSHGTTLLQFSYDEANSGKNVELPFVDMQKTDLWEKARTIVEQSLQVDMSQEQAQETVRAALKELADLPAMERVRLSLDVDPNQLARASRPGEAVRLTALLYLKWRTVGDLFTRVIEVDRVVWTVHRKTGHELLLIPQTAIRLDDGREQLQMAIYEANRDGTITGSGVFHSTGRDIDEINRNVWMALTVLIGDDRK